jgi:hypothetical protein
MANTIQLRRYELVPEERDAFLAWWRERLLPVRKAHGFEIVFAYLLADTDEFIWAVSYDGDAEEFKRAEDEYLKAPDREAAFAGIPQRVRVLKTHLVQAVALWRKSAAYGVRARQTGMKLGTVRLPAGTAAVRIDGDTAVEIGPGDVIATGTPSGYAAASRRAGRTCSANSLIERWVSLVRMPACLKAHASWVMRPAAPLTNGRSAAMTSSGVPTAAVQNPALPPRIISAVTRAEGSAATPLRSLRRP